MTPVSFHPQEQLFTSTDPNVGDLPTIRVEYADGGRGIVSCWRPSFRERLSMLMGRPVYLCVLGWLYPPVLLSTDAHEVGAKP